MDLEASLAAARALGKRKASDEDDSEDEDVISLSSDSSDDEDGPEVTGKSSSTHPQSNHDSLLIKDQPGKTFIVEDVADLQSQRLRELISPTSSIAPPPVVQAEAAKPAQKRPRRELTEEDWTM